MSAATVPNRRRSKPRPAYGEIVLRIVTIGGFLYLFAPIFSIVLFSFNKPKGKFNLKWQEFTLDNWADPLAKHDLTNALGRSLQIALIAALAATAMGGLMALALARYRFRGGALLNLLIVLPLTTPEIVMGASLLNLFVKYDSTFSSVGVNGRGFATVLISHTMFCVSFVALTVKARVSGFDWTLEDAAMDLGAPPLRTFRRVTFPLIMPGVMAAFLLSFSLSIDDFIITSFTSGQYVTFPLQIAGAFQREVSPQISVLATMILAASITLMAVGSVAKAWREGRAVLGG
jgi:spermidine/putrescine transport system permease protein